jgi:heme oxygenase
LSCRRSFHPSNFNKEATSELTTATGLIRRAPALDRLRFATGVAHRRLEDRLDAVRRLTDPRLRPALIERYAAFHLPADAALRPHLADVPGLDMAGRSRAGFFDQAYSTVDLPEFPQPASRPEALGLLYVLEGSTLGGRMILRMLAAHGVTDPALAFLDPYGARTGAQWRAFLAVLEREGGRDAGRIEDAARGAVRGFDHAEAVLCGGAP